jgi:tRNA 2-thiouridine synthesizing protein E
MVAEVVAQPLEVGGRIVATDHLGYLLDPAEWDPAMAERIAAREGIRLGMEHLAVIALVREHYGRCQSIREARTLLKALRGVLGEARATWRYLHVLFPHGYGPQVCKIAGMTMPRKVVLDV